MRYATKTAEFRADLAELVTLYDRAGLKAASARCSAIADGRGLDIGERLTLADAFRRTIILC